MTPDEASGLIVQPESVDEVPVVEVSHVSKRFGNHQALDDVSVSVYEGEVVAVLGPSGSGKSTLVRCIDQLESIDGGSMRLDGELLGFEERGGHLRPLSDAGRKRQQRRMSMVFQQFNLFPHWTVLRNVTEALVRVHGRTATDARDRATVLLERVGLAEKADAYPRHLSGGQQQRVAIVRSVAVDPRILLFDEPTSALDPELVDEVLLTMKDLAATGRTMIVVTHEMEFARDVADRCVFMADGKLIEDRPAEDFFDDPRSTRLQAFLDRSGRKNSGSA
ncbi:amino acid ABC transporter ATP-binding protein [Microbacterium sp. JB110]|uniref:amino acid ABC transporter ATP-binding protein n=1 Tax=Microbacterium sp. JB110 TaxID=2024477 RepID=UPI00097E8F43|nr:amino acid ABC transporter ATP-binding protein [Microbacterium sp. JB110]RCS60914.1 amino acid ABC transporter ATP-binding protein [Microbacterium sp. JB110]SJM64110.1 Glutamate transport ATP-binding protein gluA [Frigoribacterium sp. JB110]